MKKTLTRTHLQAQLAAVVAEANRLDAATHGAKCDDHPGTPRHHLHRRG